MNITRRQFLQRAAALHGVIITPAFVSMAWDAFENRVHLDIPPPEVSPRYRLNVFAFSERNFSFDLVDVDGNELDTLPTTFGGLLEHYGYEVGDPQVGFLMEGWDLGQAEAQKMLLDPPPEDWAETFMARHGGPQALAYHLLSKLDLGPRLSRKSHSSNRVGQVDFIDGFHLMDDTFGVEVPDAFSLTLLRARLFELNAPVLVSC